MNITISENNKFSVMQMMHGMKVSMQVYGQNSLNEDGSLMPFDEQMAIISHYLHTAETVYSRTYEQRAQGLIADICNVHLASDDKSCAVEPDVLQYSLFSDLFSVPFLPIKNPKFTFIDLFAGIGGFRIAMQNIGGKCVFSSEWDEMAKKTYLLNYGEVPFGDITKESTKSYIPDGFDVLCAGFPCQAFSVAGYRKGFEDTRGTLFFDVAEIVKRKRPKVVFLENVKNLYTHDNGNTFQVIKSTLEELGYFVFHKIMSPVEYANVPQNRERIFIVCFDKKRVPNYENFSFPEKVELTKTIHDCIDHTVSDKRFIYTEKMSHYDELKANIVSRDTVYQWRRQYVRENKSGVCPTLTANMGTGGHNVPLILSDYGIRKLTPRECLNFQGFPAEYKFPETNAISANYKQAGNSVTVPLIEKVCQEIWKIIE